MYKILIFLFFQTSCLLAQDDSSKKLKINGYAELYYTYDFTNLQKKEKPNFIFNHKKQNEINANLFLIKTSYDDKWIRARLGIMAGNYAQYNLSAEPPLLQYINEANLGIKLSQKHNLWLDLGVMNSHIGFESAISADCWTLTRSILADNSPYYETGVKSSYLNKKENLYVAFLLLNGWQKIKQSNHIQTPSVGVQVYYKFSKKIGFNYSNFIGTDQADSLKALRVFHNFYIQYESIKNLAFIGGFDIGSDKFNKTEYGIWFSPVVMLKYMLYKKVDLAFRGEYYYDKNEIIISTDSKNGFQVLGVSANLDYKFNQNICFRIEAKCYSAKNKIFDNFKNENYSLTTNMTFQF